MLTTYSLALKHLSLNTGAGVTNVSIGSSLAFFDMQNFKDPMNITPSSELNSNCSRYMIGRASMLDDFKYITSLDLESPYHDVGYEKIQEYLEDVTKAMLLAILDGDSKRTTTVGIGSSYEKRKIFFNSLYKERYRDKTIKPWVNSGIGWTATYSIANPVFVSRTSNIAIVTTSPAHGMTTAYDDWGIVMNLNTGIATSFNISTSTYPNGVPIKIVDANTFTYTNVGINTAATAVTGTADVKVGWGGTSINLHLYFT